MTNTAIISGRIENFAEYSQFKNLKEFNDHIEMFLAVHKKEFTKTEFMLFRRLTKYCAKVAGVANASIKTILAGTKVKDFILGASESTFHRMKRKAIKLGILEVKQTIRTDDSQSSNLWIFKRFVADSNTIDTPKTEGEQVKPAPAKGKVFRRLTPLKTNISSKANIKNINKRIQDVPVINQSLDSSFVPEYVPKEFVSTVKPFFNDTKAIMKLWHSSSVAVKKITGLIEVNHAIDYIITAFKESVYQHKARKVRKEFNGYYYGVLCNKLHERERQIRKENMLNNHPIFYDWLNDRG